MQLPQVGPPGNSPSAPRLLMSRHVNRPPFLLPQVRICPAWKCVLCVEGPSYPGTPTPPPSSRHVSRGLSKCDKGYVYWCRHSLEPGAVFGSFEGGVRCANTKSVATGRARKFLLLSCSFHLGIQNGAFLFVFCPAK